VISSFRRLLPTKEPESRAFLNYLIFKVKHWTPAFAGVTAPRGFYCKVGIPILFQHPACNRTPSHDLMSLLLTPVAVSSAITDLKKENKYEQGNQDHYTNVLCAHFFF
jgi:hypothetical protein